MYVFIDMYSKVVATTPCLKANSTKSCKYSQNAGTKKGLSIQTDLTAIGFGIAFSGTKGSLDRDTCVNYFKYQGLSFELLQVSPKEVPL